MFCPKCGLQNADETKFCRGCGADVSNVLAVVAPTTPAFGHPSSGRRGAAREPPALSEKYIELYGRGITGVMIGVGFFIISGLAFAFRTPSGFLWLFMLAFAFFFFSTGISRFIQARATKALNKPNELPALPATQTEYIKPLHSIYETDDLMALPLSVTEHTTTHLQMDPDGEPMTLPKK